MNSLLKMNLEMKTSLEMNKWFKNEPKPKNELEMNRRNEPRF